MKSFNGTHENHQINVQTFRHYPENIRLSTEEKKEVKLMLATAGNKTKIKAQLLARRIEQANNMPISLKSIHNMGTAVRLEKENLHIGENELQKLLDSMLKVPNAAVRVLRNEDNDLLCIFFQDERMRTLFDKYPDVLLYDATYKMNNRNMPLFIQSVVDGNGETEIVSIAICRSESKVIVEFILSCFKELNTNWKNVKCVIGDKDFADREVYKEKFNNVALQICLFHVLRTFNREITTAKRKITTEQRTKVLKILMRLCYARTEEYYDRQYQILSSLKLEHVMEYFDSNWNNIKEEWTLFGRNKFSNYLNHTNNRTESMNQKLKLVNTRNANLLTFFENVSTSLTVLSTEKDMKAVRLDMRSPRIRFEDVTLRQYHEMLTPFIFAKMEVEYNMAKTVDFMLSDEEAGITTYGRTVSTSKCSCTFHVSMNLPCRHILQFRRQNKLDLFAPEICAIRWTKRYYNASHPALTTNEEIPMVVPMYVQQIRVPVEKDKYKAVATLTKDINSLVSTMATPEFTFHMERLSNYKNRISGNPPRNNENIEIQGKISKSFIKLNSFRFHTIGEVVASISEPNVPVLLNENSSNTYVRHNNDVAVVLDLSLHKVDVTSNSSEQEENAIDFSLSNVTNGNINRHESLIDQPFVTTNALQPNTNSCSQSTVNHLLKLNTFPSQFGSVVIASTRSPEVKQIKLPYKRVSIGRPKGSVNTVIGTRRMALKQPTKKSEGTFEVYELSMF